MSDKKEIRGLVSSYHSSLITHHEQEMSMTAAKMEVPSLDLKQQHLNLRDELRAALGRVLDSQQFILGEDVRLLESELVRYTRARHAVGCGSGSDALLLALLALDVKEGSEVVTTPFTFFATAGARGGRRARPRRGAA